MKEFQIIEYNSNYKEKLNQYFHKIDPDFSDQYIDFIVDQAVDEEGKYPAFLVINDKDDIVGCHMYYYNTAKIQGKIEPLLWGHDTFLDKEYRKYAGLDFILKTYTRLSYGIGISPVNKKILKKSKGKFWEINNYFFFNIFIIWNLIQRVFKIKPNLSLCKINKIKTGKQFFELAEKVSDLKIPNNGFWNDKDVEADFNRGEKFMDYRFFNNPIFKYQVYHLNSYAEKDDCYFVVRAIHHKEMKTLCIVDYRYDVNNLEQLHLILKAANKIAKKNHCGMIHLLTSDKNIEAVIKNRFHIKRPGDFATPWKYKFDKNRNIIATTADSDGDYHR